MSVVGGVIMTVVLVYVQFWRPRSTLAVYKVGMVLREWNGTEYLEPRHCVHSHLTNVKHKVVSVAKQKSTPLTTNKIVFGKIRIISPVLGLKNIWGWIPSAFNRSQ